VTWLRECLSDNASQESKAAKVGVRRQRRSVGEKASLQPTKKKTAKPQASKWARKTEAPPKKRKGDNEDTSVVW
jgi:hypothetical protein